MPEATRPFLSRPRADSGPRRPQRRRARLRLAITALLATCLVSEALAQTAPVPRPKRKGTQYSVVIDSAPQQAAVYLDDEKYGVVGYTPYKGRLTKGGWKLILKRDGFVTSTQDIAVDYKSRKFFAVLAKEVLPATLKISAAVDPQVKDAWVHLDGKYVGKAPLELKVPAGRHQVALQKKGFDHLSQWVELKEGETIQMAPSLQARQAAAGSVLVDANVAGAQVWLDGKQHPDPTPTVLDDLAPGTHVVEVRFAGAPAWKKAVEVKSGERLKLLAELAVPEAPAAGSLLVDADLASAEVWVDGKLQADKTPTVVDKLAPGDHEIEVRKPPAVPWRSKVTVKSGERIKVEAKLLATTAAAKAAEEAARAAAAKAAAGTGTVRILTSVAKAEVLLDGKVMGRSPDQVTRALDIKFVPVGKHEVSARAEGGLVASAQVEVTRDAVVQVPLRLAVPEPPEVDPAVAKAAAEKAAAEKAAAEKAAAGGVSIVPEGPTGTLKVIATVVGANVKVDGKLIGVAPLEVKLTPGEHVVLVAAPGTTPFSQRANIAVNLTTTVNAQLKQGLPTSSEIGRGTDGQPAAVAPVTGQPPAPADGALTGPPAPLEHYDPTMLMRSTLGARPLPEGVIAFDIGGGYPYWLHARATFGMVNDLGTGMDGAIAYRSGLKIHEALATVRYRILGTGPGILTTFGTVGGGGGAGGLNNFTVQGGASATLVFGEKVAISARGMLEFWTDRLCREPTAGQSVGSDAPAGCVTDSTSSRYSQAAQDMTSDGAGKRDTGFRLLGGLSLEIALSPKTNLWLQGDMPVAGVEKRAAFSSRFNDLMISTDDQGWLARVGVTFKL